MNILVVKKVKFDACETDQIMSKMKEAKSATVFVEPKGLKI